MSFLDDASKFFNKNNRTLRDINTITSILGGPRKDEQNNPLTSGFKFSYRDHLLHLMSTQWGFGTPNQSLWIVFINTYPGCLTTGDSRDINTYRGIEKSRAPGGNDISSNVKELTRRDYQYTDAGCVFATSVGIPGEVANTQYNSTISKSRGFLRGITTNGRTDFVPVTIIFRETNRSFVDAIIRPWIVSTSHHGFVARPFDDPKNVKTTVQVLQLGKTLAGAAPVNRKIHRFYNCAPVSIESASISYGESESRDINSQWAFTDYDIEQLPDLPMELVINEILGGTMGKLLNKVDKSGKVKKFISRSGNILDGVKDTASTVGRVFDAL